MKIENNVELSRYTTFRMGGNVKLLYSPEELDDLKLLYREGKLHHIIGGGSNLLINDSIIYDTAVSLRNLNNEFQIISEKENGIFYIGSSVRLQTAIKKINTLGYGGIEYLYSVPGLIGGAIFMNAGRGKEHNQSISDYIVSVDYFHEGKLKQLDNSECDFRHRYSIFQSLDNCIIMGARFRFPKTAEEVTKQRVEDRLELCRNLQDNSKPNFGTVFCIADHRIMKIIKLLSKNRGKGIQFSAKTENWMLHGKNGTFQNAITLIHRVEIMHKLVGKQCKLEVKIWYD